MGVLPLTEQLAGASADAYAATRAIARENRVDLATLPRGALALLLAQAAHEHDRRFLVLTPDAQTAQKLEADLRFFAADGGEGLGSVLHYPGADTTPFVDVAPDQRAAMDRLSVLFHLSQRLAWRALIVPVAAALRRVPPRAAIERRCARIAVADIVDREQLIGC